ncbi:MAG: hypothetical protein AAB448_00195 [Patescibacteria group bacterium]
MLRMRGPMLNDGKPVSWWIWSGDDDIRKVGSLTPEQKTFPILGVANDTAIKEIIEGTYQLD